MSPGADNNFGMTLRRAAQGRPQAAALIEASSQLGRVRWHTTTFAQLDAQADRLARGLSGRGVQRNDRVLVLLRPGKDLYAVLYSLFRIGAIPVLIDPGMGLKAVLSCVRAIRPSTVIAIPMVQAIRLLSPRAFESCKLAVTSGAGLAGVPLARIAAEGGIGATEAAAVAAEDECLIAFTSGSTGPAKGVSFTHGMLDCQARMLHEAYGWQPGESMVMCFAAFALFSLAAEMTTILPAMNFSRPAKAKPSRVAEAIERHGAQVAFASPIVWVNLARAGNLRATSFSSLRQVITTGAPISIDLHLRFRKLLPADAELLTPYGATEALPLSTLGTREVLEDTAVATRKGAGTCVGQLFEGVDARVIQVTDEPIAQWNEELRVTAGQVGELVVGGRMVSPEYKDNPGANAQSKIRCDGGLLHRMGDLVAMDEQGRLWFCGRKAHRLETSQGMIAPVPVENIFNAHAAVFRTALVGLGDKGNEMPVLCVEMASGEELTATIRAELESLAAGTRFEGVVRDFLQHPGFPVDPRHNSKIKREELREWAAKRLPRNASQENLSQ